MTSCAAVCGIAGVARFDEEVSRTRAQVDAMCSAIRHRGPDGGGVTEHPDATLGMTRLAIVDVEHGAQPMLSDDGGVALVFNGEIYNAPALRAELEREGVRFRTRSDTEVILRLYERDPERTEHRLRGMWAFAIHDRRRRKLVLSRDRFGIKPLYFTTRGAGFAFGSEMTALRALRDHRALANVFELDRGCAHAMLSFSYIPNDATIFAGVRKLPPATRLTLDLVRGGHVMEPHYQLMPSTEAARVTTLGEACELVEPALAAAVKEHLESDVPVAAFMSGGIDSSLVALHAARASSKPIRGFAIGFRERAFDESPFARETAKKIGLELTVEILDEEKARGALAGALVAYDEPFGDSSSVATYLLSQIVSVSHKVALGGDGGDEIFAGYRKHRIIGVRELFGAPLRDAFSRVLHGLPARTDRTSRVSELLRSARRLARGLRGSDAEAYLALTQIAPLARTAALVESEAIAARFEGPIRDTFERTPGTQLQRTLASDLANVLPNDMLTKVDRASMACHLEARVPLLDHRLVEIGLGLPRAFTLEGGKRVLRALHERHFGAALAHRRKQGFGVPVERWLRGPLAPACDRLFAASELTKYGLLSASALAGGKWREWARTDPQILWNCFALAAWCEVHLGGGRSALDAILA